MNQKILDAELSGIGLAGEQRERFNAIVQELSQAGTDFSNHVLDATKASSIVLTERADVEGLPPSLLRLASQSYNSKLRKAENARDGRTGPWRFTLEFPSLWSLPAAQPPPRSARKVVSGEHHAGLVGLARTIRLWSQKILSLRAEEARLLGFATFAELSLAKNMAPERRPPSRPCSRSSATRPWSAAQSRAGRIRSLAAESVPDLGGTAR